MVDKEYGILVGHHGNEPRRFIDDYYAAVALNADNLAGVGIDGSYSYAELDQLSNRIATGLVNLGIEPGSAVGVRLTESCGLVATLIAVFKLHAVYVPIDSTLPLNRVREMLAEAQAVVVLLEEGHDCSGLPCPGVLLNEIRYSSAGSINVRQNIPASRICYQTYTSGSTGRPKPIRISERSMMSYVSSIIARYGLSPCSSVLTTASISFDASIREIICSLLTGSTLHIVQRRAGLDVSSYVESLRRNNVSAILSMTPSILKSVLTTCSHQHVDIIEALKLLSIGGEVLDFRTAEMAQRLFPAARIINHYGPSECTMTSTAWVFDKNSIWNARLPVGTPNWNTAIAILDQSTNGICELDEEGEVSISGYGVCLDYATAAPNYHEISEDLACVATWPCYRTGDIGYVSRDGNLYILGRKDEQIKLRGIRVEPNEITQALTAIDGVDIATTIATKDDLVGYRLDSYVVLVEGSRQSTTSLMHTLKSSLPSYLVPATITALSELPVNRHGKLDRSALPKPVLPRIATQGSATVVEEEICRQFSEVLGIDNVQVDESFFDLGGHSLLAAHLTLSINEVMRCDLLLEEIFNNRTPRALAALINMRKTPLPRS
ncbi:non-ribosomal peptide synthetase [Rhizobium leguminosarum]|uniref:non-ribosomal peptide synthetase n=1 Tax=Rhizobium leguminosarum TaxID=384 RepID=UPI003ECF46EA